MKEIQAGFVAIVGRPNAGKSTLTNAMVGEKIAIMSDRPETTRRAIRGIVHRENGQLVVVDTPGLHKPKTMLGKRLNDMVHESVDDVDAVVVCLPANEPVGPGDRGAAALAFSSNAPVVAAVTKTDRVSREKLPPKLIEVSRLGDFAAIVPVSAVKGRQVEDLVSVLVDLMPQSYPLYPDDHITDESLEVRISELVREAALEGVHDELPHSLHVMIDEISERDNGVLAIYASLIVERDSQKGIIIGHKGSRLKQVGMRARREIEALVDGRVHLDLHVKVLPDWQRDPKQLGKLGFV